MKKISKSAVPKKTISKRETKANRAKAFEEARLRILDALKGSPHLMASLGASSGWVKVPTPKGAPADAICMEYRDRPEPPKPRPEQGAWAVCGLYVRKGDGHPAGLVPTLSTGVLRARSADEARGTFQRETQEREPDLLLRMMMVVEISERFMLETLFPPTPAPEAPPPELSA